MADWSQLTLDGDCKNTDSLDPFQRNPRARQTMQTGISKQLQESYSRQYSPAVIPWRDVGALYKADHIIELCTQANISPSTILEVGAGEGGILARFEALSFGQTLTALEISEVGVEFIKARNLKTLAQVSLFDGYRIPFADKSFDLVVLSHVLEHVEFERTLLREIKRVATFAAIEVPLDFTWAVDTKVEHFLSYGHINIYTPPQLRFLLQSEGFEILCDVSNINGPEVVRYAHFNLKKNPRTPEAEAELDRTIQEDQKVFDALNRTQKEQRARDYAVLCRCTDSALQVFKQSTAGPA